MKFDNTTNLLLHQEGNIDNSEDKDYYNRTGQLKNGFKEILTLLIKDLDMSSSTLFGLCGKKFNPLG